METQVNPVIVNVTLIVAIICAVNVCTELQLASKN